MRIECGIPIKRNRTPGARANHVRGRGNLEKRIPEVYNRPRVRIIGDMRENRLLRA
jgi:hypothetical protein